MHRLDSSQAVRAYVGVGTRSPLHATASGQAIMAFLPEERVRAVVSGVLARFTGETLTDPHVVARLAGVREPGDHALAGDHRGRDAVMDIFRALGGVGGGTLRVGDTHVVALMSTSAERDGQRIRADVAEVYEIRDGRISDIRAYVYDQDAWNAAFT